MSAAVEVGLGLAFTFFLFATLASGFNELIARVLNSRGTALFSAINALIGDTNVAAAFWDQELVKSLGRARAPRSRAGSASVPDQLWPASGATGTLFEPAAPGGPASAQRPVKGAQARALPSYIPPHTFALALVQARKQVAQPGAAAAAASGPHPSAVDQVVHWALAITAAAAKPSAAAGSGSGAGGAGQQPVEAYGQVVLDHLAAWFNGAMDRLSGMYKRRAQLILLALSAAAVGAFNLNTVHIARELWMDPTLRAQIAANAQAVTSSTTAPSSTTSTTVAASTTATTTASGCTLGPAGNSGSVACAITQAKILPIGWAAMNTPKGAFGADGWFWAVIGWLLSLGALALGAPFWFNLLSRLGSLRSTGPPPSASSSPSSA